MFHYDNIHKGFTGLHYPIFEHQDTLSFAFLVCIILYIDGKQLALFTFVQYIKGSQVIISNLHLEAILAPL